MKNSRYHTTEQAYAKANQRVSFTGNGKSEDFLWDGLALIHRGETSFVNEPYVTGGNPVMAGDNVLFNDMLGSTLAVNEKAVEMTSFGETGDKNAFFTGKPMIDELGYSFLFRDYNPNQGKWTTSGPLGYPDGWNNLAYCNNSVTIAFDWLGSKIVIRGSEQYIQNVKNLIVKLISTPSGKLVYDFLSNSERTHCIVEGNLNDSAFAHNVGQPSDTTIVFSAKPRTEGDFVSPAWAVLGHEMNHSFFLTEEYIGIIHLKILPTEYLLRRYWHVQKKIE